LDTATPVVCGIFHRQIVKKGHTAQGKKMAPNNNNNRGMTHQTDEKPLKNMTKYFVGVVKLAFYC
jgi:hypothetical protein